MSISNKVKSFFQSVMKPSPAAVSQALKTLNLKPHVPMIRFRKDSGAGAGHAGHGQAVSVPPSPAFMRPGGAQGASAPSTPLKPNQAMQFPVIEDWQLPSRYRRRPIDPEEVAYINRGGPDKI